MSGIPKDPRVRLERARKAGQASGAARLACIRQRMRGTDAGLAWQLGYRVGYNLAMKRWKAYADRVIREAYARRRA